MLERIAAAAVLSVAIVVLLAAVLIDVIGEWLDGR